MSDLPTAAPFAAGFADDGVTGGHGHHVTSMFANRETADRAADALVEAGVARSAIDVVDQGGDSFGTTDESGGFWDSLKRMFTGEDADSYYAGINRGQVLVRVRTRDDSEADRASAVLDRFDPVDLDAQESSWRHETGSGTGLTGVATTGMAPAGTAAAGMAPTAGTTSALAGRATDVSATTARDVTGEQVIPVVEERIKVGKRDTGRGSVRVRVYTAETPFEQDIRLRSERVQVERRPVDRATTAGAEAFRDRSFEMTETSEEAVVAKEARVVEEVVVRKDVSERTEHVQDSTRRTEVEIEDDRTKGGVTSTAMPPTGVTRPGS